MPAVKPKKFLGQHFLKDLDIARRIADTLDELEGVPLIEVGPGMGVLNQFLIEKNKELTVVELDKESVHYLNE
ncbi:MAG: rRNA adenine N-6-methyltransferase family protein, partial [Dysgonomonas sp.]